MKNRFVVLAILCLFFHALGPVSRCADVIINEFLASNSQSRPDEDNEFPDWIELQNVSGQAVNMAGWFLTDDATFLQKWEFPSVSIAANSFLVVHASGKNRTTPRLHTNFSIDAEGEYLALVMPDGTVAAEFNPFPEQRRDVSYGYDLGRGSLVFFTAPTPGSANTTGVVDFVADISFSHNRGFYDAPFDLVISCKTAGATIRYTTSGMAPTATTGALYTGPVRITGTTVLRAAAFKTGFRPSEVDTQTYLFTGDIIRQSPTGTAPAGWPSTWGGNTVDYGMDPAIVDDPRYRNTIQTDLRTLPSFSIVMKLDDLFNGSTGIYANPGQDGRDWERPCSLELINADGSKGFQANAGIRIRGGFSRSPGNPKHAFRFFFREEYGDSKLQYPLFGDQGTAEFDKIDLRTFQNYSWSFQGDGNGVFLRDQWSRDTQLEMGHQAERGNFYHLYVNGQYWGIYNTCERPEAAYAATYYGGNREDWDVIKVEAGPYSINATDGDMTAWTTLYDLCRPGIITEAAYQRLMGNNADGTPNPAYPVLLDMDNLIDYMLLIIYTGNLDAPISNFLSNTRPNNWYGVRNRNDSFRQGFRFFAHDSEHTLLPWDVGRDRTGPFSAGESSVTYSNPQWVWQKLTAYGEFKLRVADRVHKHFFNNGALATSRNIARFMERKGQIDRAVVAESARWGDAKVGQPLNRDDHWLPAIQGVVNGFFNPRFDIVMGQLRADGLYPAVAAPSFNQFGGNVSPGFALSMSGPAGATIYFTLDGSDPRRPGGSVSASAQRYATPRPLNENLKVKARVLSGTTWSALTEASFTIIRTYRELMVTELMYNPKGEVGTDGEKFEFLELKNASATELDLSGVRFTNGVLYTFPNGTRLSPGQFAVIVSDPVAFAARYPNVRFEGVFTNNLSNGGERVTLVHAAGGVISDFTYSDRFPWPIAADGTGFSLVPATSNPLGDFSDATSWRASARIGGSPGRDDPPSDVPEVIVNEVLTHTDLPQVDAVELFNPGTLEANITGWFLTDDRSVPKKYRIGNVIIPPGGFKTFSEGDFNPVPGLDPGFSLDSHGEEVFLFSADAEENLTGYSHGLTFGAAENGVSFGRYLNSVGDVSYPAQKALSFGELNPGPKIGPVVINEIAYAPAGGEAEFIELKNFGGSAVRLQDPANPGNTWKLEGVGFSFPTDVAIPAKGLLVVCAADPAAFRARYSIPASVPVLGPFTGVLQDNGELIELMRPDAPDRDPAGQTIVPYITVDAVRYDELAPWPMAAGGSGSSLERVKADLFGNDPSSWRASPGPASPGLDNDGNRLPVVDAGADRSFVAGAFPHAATFAGTATDDGLPSGTLSYQWSVASAPAPVLISNSDQLAATFSFPGVGTYVLRFAASDGQLSASDTVEVVIARPLAETIFVTKGSRWKFEDTGTDLGTDWRDFDYNDSGWKEGQAQLGYGDGDETKTISSGPAGARFMTAYFRHQFAVDDPASVVSLALRLLRDDGAVIYLNGREVVRENMPTDTISFATPASNVVGGGDESTFYEKGVDPTALRSGANVLAVEVHQNNPGSSDLSFDLELVGQISFSNQAPKASAGPDLTLDLPTAANLKGSATDDGLPNPPGVFTATWSFLNGPGTVTFANPNLAETTAAFSKPGVYNLKLTVTDGQLTAEDTLRVTATGGDAYTAWRQQYFTSAELGDPLVSGEDGDPDGDGFRNREEFVAGTNPRDALSYLRVEDIQPIEDYVVVKFNAVADRSYSIQVSDSLQSGDWNTILDLSPQAASKPVEVLDQARSVPSKFYRVVTPIPPPTP